MTEYPKVNRVEIIDHRPCTGCQGSGVIMNNKGNGKGMICGKCEGLMCEGRSIIVAGPAYNQPDNARVSVDFQDDGKTLKIFISTKEVERN